MPAIDSRIGAATINGPPHTWRRRRRRRLPLAELFVGSPWNIAHAASGVNYAAAATAAVFCVRSSPP